MRIAVKKGALGASSSAQLSTASLYSMPTVDDLCAVLKDGSSESNVASAEEIAEPLPTDVVTMIENGSLLDLFSTMNESVSVDDDTSNTSPSSRASNMITLYSGIEEQNQNGPSVFQPIHRESITAPKPFLTFPAIQENVKLNEITLLPPKDVSKVNQEASSRETAPANEDEHLADETIPENVQTTDIPPDIARSEVVQEEEPVPGPSHRSESNNEIGIQSESVEDNIDIDENDLDQAFFQVFHHFGKTSAASEIVKTLLDDPDTLNKCLDTFKKGPIMVCPCCLHIFTTVGPYIDHYPQCTKPRSSKIEKLFDRAAVSELALVLWRNAVVAQIAKLPSGAKFIQQENQLHHELDMLWNECSTHQMLHCHELFHRVAVHVLTRKPILPAVEKLYNDANNKKKKASKAQRANADKAAVGKVSSRTKKSIVAQTKKGTAQSESLESKKKKRTAEDMAINAMLNDTEGLIGSSDDPYLAPGSVFEDFGNRSSRRVQNTKRRKLLSENEDFDMITASDSGVGTLTPESDRPSEMMTPFTDPMTDRMMQLSDSELAVSDVDQRPVSQIKRRFLPPRSARPCMKTEDQQKKLQKGPPVGEELSCSKKRVTPSRAAKTKDYFKLAGNGCFESIEVIGQAKPSTSKVHRRRKSTNDQSPPPLRCLSPNSPHSATSDNIDHGDWMPTLSPNKTSSPNDDNAIDDTRSISPLSDTESIVFICDTSGIKKKSPKVVDLDDDDSRPFDIKTEANFDNVDLPEDELERLFKNVLDDEGAAAAAREIERFEVSTVVHEEEEPSEGEYLVNQILNRRLRNNVPHPKDSDYEYLVSWEGYGDAENTWEPYENLAKCTSKLEAFLDLTKKRAWRNRKGKRL